MSITNSTENFLARHVNNWQIYLWLDIVSHRQVIRRPTSSTIKFSGWSGGGNTYRLISVVAVWAKHIRSKKSLSTSQLLTQIEVCHNICNGKLQGFWCSNIPWTWKGKIANELEKSQIKRISLVDSIRSSLSYVYSMSRTSSLPPETKLTEMQGSPDLCKTL